MWNRLIVLVLLLPAAAACGADEDPVVAGQATTTTSTSPPTTSVSTTATSTTTAPPAQESPGGQAVWPVESSTTRYRDPVAAVRGFAVELAGFRDPVVGTFRAGDARSGEVEVRPTGRGPVTTVLVRQLGADGSWWVTGSATPNIELATPTPGARVTSPVRLAGRARAYEGTVHVVVREDGSTQALGSGFVTGSGGGELGPFQGEVAFTRRPAQSRGVLLLFTESAEDGRVWEVAAVRLELSGG